MSRPLPRYLNTTPADPLDRMLEERKAARERARQQVNAGRIFDADPQDLRGIPVIARGVGGTSPGTNPLTETIRRDHRLSA